VLREGLRDDAAERMTDDRGPVDLQGVEQQLEVVGEIEP